jgi:succinylarginine dihydrolase
MPQQHPDGIDAGAFHTDVLAVGNGRFFMVHELAFSRGHEFIDEVRALLGDELVVAYATNVELPVSRAVASYVFNSQVISLADGSMAIVAPADAREDGPSATFLQRVIDDGGPVRAVHYVDVRQSMHNGGGPACLRLRVPLSDEEANALSAGVLFDDALDAVLRAWVARHYRDRLVASDLADPALAREGMVALDELTRLLGMPSVYDFQGAPGGDALRSMC